MEEGTADEGAQFTFYWERSCPGITEGGDAAVPEAGAGLVRNHGGGHRRVKSWAASKEGLFSPTVSSFVPACLGLAA